jgi:hypothetical protein
MKAIVLVVALAATMIVSVASADEVTTLKATYQGKSAKWWALHAQQARRDANARAATIRVLRRELDHDPSVQEAVALASMAYPAMKPCSAWAIIRHESRGDPNAKNPSSTASGLWQFLISTFNSTPYGKAGFSVFSPYASSLAAGWMHQQGRGNEWNISRC